MPYAQGQVWFGSKADRPYMNAARLLRLAQQTNAEASLNVCDGPKADIAV